jgi:hypothetical protein
MLHLILFIFFATWLLFDFFAVKKDVDGNLGEKKVVLDFFLAFPIFLFKTAKKLVTKKAPAK